MQPVVYGRSHEQDAVYFDGVTVLGFLTEQKLVWLVVGVDNRSLCVVRRKKKKRVLGTQVSDWRA